MIPIKYNVRSLFVRRGTTLMTIFSIALVVLVYVGVLSLAGGIQAAFSDSGDPATVVVTRDGAQAEMDSGFAMDTRRLLATLPGVVKDSSGNPIASGETMHLQIIKRGDGTEANVALRGVEDEAFTLRPWLEIVDGRRFEAGKGEIIVGSMVAERFPALALGNQIRLGRDTFRVVGVFDGAAYSSEIWGSVNDLGDSYRRPNYYSSTRIKAASASAVPELLDRIEAEQRLQVQAERETDFYARQTESNTRLFVVLANVLAFFMAFGACFAAANTMYAQVSSRSKEIGTLRALGFKRHSIVAAFVIEATVLGLVAGVVGVLFALPLNAVTAGTMNQANFSELTFALRTTPTALISGVLLAVLTGVIGGLPPAVRAARRSISDLLREA
jgi:putative ABC transport system permease protein